MPFAAALFAAHLVAARPALHHAAVVTTEPTIAAHHAVYDLSLKSSQDQGVLSARGTMIYDITDACSGLTTTQHLSIDLTDRDGRDVTMVSDYATIETRDGTKLEFHTRQLNGSQVTEALDGKAVLDRSGGRGHADYTSPEHKRVSLPDGTLLPNAHTLTILKAGEAGKRFLSAPLFDGTDANGAEDTFVTIETWQKPRTEKWSALSSLPSGRVHVAFFGRDQGTETPDYEVGMRYFSNGVADDLAMNFGDFVMAGRLAELEIRPDPRC
jgi:hypothetical protein